MASLTSTTILLLLTFAIFSTESTTDVTKIAETVLADLLAAQTKRDLHGYRYKVTGAKEGTKFSHSQKVQHGETRGEYRLLLPDDRWQIVSYVADEQGYRATVRYESNNPSKPLDATDSKVTHWGFSRQKNKPLTVEVPVEWEEPEEVHPRPRPVHHQHPQVDTFVVHPPPKSHQHRPPPVRPPPATGWTTPPPPPAAAWSTPSPHSHSAPRPRPHIPSAPTVPVLSTDGWKPMPPHPPEKPKVYPPVTSFKGQPGFQFYDSRLASTPLPPAPVYRPPERHRHPPSKPNSHHEEDDPVVYKPNVHHPFLEPDPEIPSTSYVATTTKPPLHPLYPIHEYHDKTKPYYQLVPAHLTSNQPPQSVNKKPHSGYPGVVVIRPNPQHPHDQHHTMIRPEDYEHMEGPTRPPNIYNTQLLNKLPPYPPPPYVGNPQADESDKQQVRPKYPHSGYPPAPVTSEQPLNRKPGQVTAYQDPLPLPPSYRPAPTQAPNVYENNREPLQVETPSRRPGQLSVYKKPYTQPTPDYDRPASYPTEVPELYNERPKPRPTPFTAYNKRPAVSYSTTTEYPLRQAPKPWIPVPSTTETPPNYEQEEDEQESETPKRRPTSPVKSFRPKEKPSTSTTTTTTEYPLTQAPEEVIDDPPPPPPTKRRPQYSPSIKPFKPKQRPAVESLDETESTTRRPPYRPVSKKPLPERYDAGHQNAENKPIRQKTTTTATTTTTRTPKIYQSSIEDEVIERPRKKPAKKQPNQDTATEILNRLKLKHTVMDNFGMRTQPLTHTEESRMKQTFLPGDVELIETNDEARIILRKGNKYKMADLDVLLGEENVVLNEQLLFPSDTPEFQEFHTAGDVPKMSEMKETLAELKAKVLSTTTTTAAPDYEASSVRSLNTTKKGKRKGVRRRNQSVATSRIAKRKNVVAKTNNETTTVASTTKPPLILARLPSKVRISQSTIYAKEKEETKT